MTAVFGCFFCLKCADCGGLLGVEWSRLVFHISGQLGDNARRPDCG
jgi:hypothetical protein